MQAVRATERNLLVQLCLTEDTSALARQGGQLNVAPMLEVENFTNLKKRFMCHIVGIEPQFKNILLNGQYVPMIAGQRKPEGQWTSDERKAVNLDQQLKSLILFVLPDDQMNSDFPDSPDDEEDTRYYHEYLNDLEEKFQERALLAKSKRFFKKGSQRFRSAKATDETQCHKNVRGNVTLSKLESLGNKCLRLNDQRDERNMYTDLEQKEYVCKRASLSRLHSDAVSDILTSSLCNSDGIARIPDAVSTVSLRQHLEEIHVTWTQFGKKQDKIATLHKEAQKVHTVCGDDVAISSDGVRMLKLQRQKKLMTASGPTDSKKP
ncbi:hypothetical protein Tco_1114471 [Tanacetum coccineum]|uniref:Uncharacterized protein n=1 Tax=Tanacetum coccineum TaxID=301880 RepID=A0ABQ5IV72_9ASTR